MKLAINKNSNLCQVTYCRNKPTKGRKTCGTCRFNNWLNKGDNRLLIVWHWIKKSAGKRNIIFDLDKTEFKEFLLKHNYIKYSGHYKNNFTIDRIKPELGYTINNLQVITRSQNTTKYNLTERNLPF